MTARPHAVVVGASIAGLSTACALARAGWSVRVVERRPDLEEGGRAFLVQPNGLAALASLGALDLVRERGLVASTVVFYGRRATPAAVYSYRELKHPFAYGVTIRPQELRRALATRAEQLGAPGPSFGCEAIDVLRLDGAVKGVRCRNEDGSEVELEADLVVGADGGSSRVRRALGIDCRRFSRVDRYVLGTVDVTRDTRDIEIHCGAGYADGIAPLPGATYFWDVVGDANSAAVEAGDLEAWQTCYRRRVRCAHEFVDALDNWEQLTLMDVRPFWAAERVAPGAVLVGDAAGAVHPHSAQGANLALEDAAALGKAPLATYARTRQRKLRRYVLWSLLAAGSFDGPNAAWRAFRWYGFLWARVGPVRRELLRRQAGLA